MRAILPDERSLDCNSIAWETKRVVIEVSSTRSTAACPCCGQLSERVHSRYVRTLADLPWQGWEVELHWHCRRFFCTNANCRQRIFTERLPEVAAPHARRTCRLGIILNALAFACGGEEGARLAKRLGIRSSPDTLLREIRRTAEEDYPPVRFLGVDDWAMRRGQRYGTILVDLERHRPIDLLPERSAEAFANWLQVHPEVVVISRDRGDCYIKGAGEGAPQAIQVADRWHLLHNMQEALVLTVDRHRSQLKEVAQQMQRSAVEEPPADPLPEPPLPRAPMAPAKAKQASGERRERRLQRFEQVKELHARGVGVREIARQMHMHRRTVRRWIGRETFPERAIRSPRRQVDAWREYLQRRWAQGCRNARTLTAELKTEGYKGSYDMVRRCVASWRQTGCLERRRPSCPGPRVPVLRLADRDRLGANEVGYRRRGSAADVGSALPRRLSGSRSGGAVSTGVSTTGNRARGRSLRSVDGSCNGRASGAGDSAIRGRTEAGSSGRPSSALAAVEQWSDGGAGEPAQADQAPDVRTRQFRSLAAKSSGSNRVSKSTKV